MVENDETVDVLKVVAGVWIFYAVFQMIPASILKVVEMTKSFQVIFQLTVSILIIVLGTFMLYESQRYIHMCTKGKLLLDNPDLIQHYFKQGKSSKSFTNWPEVCLGKLGTGHLLDLVPPEQYEEFQIGLNIFRAFQGKMEDFTHAVTKYEPFVLKSFTYELDKMISYQENIEKKDHKSINYENSIIELNKLFSCSKYTFSLTRLGCPALSVIADRYPVAQNIYTEALNKICLTPTAMMRSEDFIKYLVKDDYIVEKLEFDQITILISKIEESLPSCVKSSNKLEAGEWLMGHFRCVSSHDKNLSQTQMLYSSFRKKLHHFLKQISKGEGTYSYVRQDFVNSFRDEEEKNSSKDNVHHSHHGQDWKFSHSSLNCRDLKQIAMKLLKGACHGEIYGRMGTNLAISSWILGLLGLLSSILSIFELVIGQSSGVEMRKWVELGSRDNQMQVGDMLDSYQTELTSSRI